MLQVGVRFSPDTFMGRMVECRGGPIDGQWRYLQDDAYDFCVPVLPEVPFYAEPSTQVVRTELHWYRLNREGLGCGCDICVDSEPQFTWLYYLEYKGK